MLYIGWFHLGIKELITYFTFHRVLFSKKKQNNIAQNSHQIPYENVANKNCELSEFYAT